MPSAADWGDGVSASWTVAATDLRLIGVMVCLLAGP